MKKGEEDDYEQAFEQQDVQQQPKRPDAAPAPGSYFASTDTLTSSQRLSASGQAYPPPGASQNIAAGPGSQSQQQGLGARVHERPLASMKGNPIALNGSIASAGTGRLCPELSGATVPEGKKFFMKVPMLLHGNVEDQEHALVRTVQAKDGTPMFNLKITRRKPLPNETNHPEEYITLSLPEEDSRELVLCAFGKPFGKLECHIYQLGKDPWGIIREDTGTSGSSYTVFLRNSTAALTATVQGTESNRRVRVVQSQSRETDVAIAMAKTDGGPNNECYEVECYPFCDIILTIIMLTGVDRMSVNSHR